MQLNPIEIEQTLKTMHILVDSREHPTDNAKKRWDAFGVPYTRTALKSGDYSAVFTLPDKSTYDMRNICVVERKMSFGEICNNFCGQRKRFVAEFERLKSAHTKCYLLVEEATWEKAYSGNYRSLMKPQALIASLTAWLARYDCVPIFCKAETTSKLIREILYREAKERLAELEIDENEQ